MVNHKSKQGLSGGLAFIWKHRYSGSDFQPVVGAFTTYPVESCQYQSEMLTWVNIVRWWIVVRLSPTVQINTDLCKSLLCYAQFHHHTHGIGTKSTSLPKCLLLAAGCYLLCQPPMWHHLKCGIVRVLIILLYPDFTAAQWNQTLQNWRN